MNLSASKLVTTTHRQHGLPVVTGNAHAEISAAPLWSKVQAFTLSRPLRRALGYYAVC
jgi:hypothetical protein